MRTGDGQVIEAELNTPGRETCCWVTQKGGGSGVT